MNRIIYVPVQAIHDPTHEDDRMLVTERVDGYLDRNDCIKRLLQDVSDDASLIGDDESLDDETESDEIPAHAASVIETAKDHLERNGLFTLGNHEYCILEVVAPEATEA